MIALLWALWTPAVAQQEPGPAWPVDIERFRPAVDPYGFVVTESATTLGNLQVGFGTWVNHSRNTLVLYQEGERLLGPAPRLGDALDHRTMIDLQLAMGFGRVVSIAVDVPGVLWQEGYQLPDGELGEAAELLPAGLGDPRVGAKVMLKDIDRGVPVGVAMQLVATVPVGEQRSLIGDGSASLTPILIIEAANRRSGDRVRDREYGVRVAANLGARIKAEDLLFDTVVGTEFVYRASVEARSPRWLGIGADISGAVGGGGVASMPVEILPWLSLGNGKRFALTLGAGFGLSQGIGTPTVRGFGGLTVSGHLDPNASDRDEDGVFNREDVCINIPEDLDGFEDRDGCPDYDNDGDGLVDTDDSCPLDPEDVDGFRDEDGCPDHDNDRDGVVDAQDHCPGLPEDVDGFNDLDGCPDDDNDGDKIPDTFDACPNAAETVNEHQDQDGCPDEAPFRDEDGDGIQDGDDKCPQAPEDLDEWLDEDGCPDEDNDLDGIYDVEDQCPFEVETVNNYLDDDGCPDEVPQRVIVHKQKITITEKIYFDYGRAVIQSASFGLLEEIAQVLQDQPRLTLVQVEGHTDADGSSGFNERLSQSRAQAVVDFLVEAGVGRERLVARGFGESMPIATNETRSGRARNRRVEFTILEQE